jgi:hypothetical protein
MRTAAFMPDAMLAIRNSKGHYRLTEINGRITPSKPVLVAPYCFEVSPFERWRAGHLFRWPRRKQKTRHQHGVDLQHQFAGFPAGLPLINTATRKGFHFTQSPPCTWAMPAKQLAGFRLPESTAFVPPSVFGGEGTA